MVLTKGVTRTVQATAGTLGLWLRQVPPCLTFVVRCQFTLRVMDELNMIVGIAWYRPEQYGLLRALSSDADSMASTYKEWLAGVTKTMDDLRQRGIVARRVDVEVKELAAWCQQRGRPLDGEARSTYAAENLKSEDHGT